MSTYQIPPLTDATKFENLVNDLCTSQYDLEFQVYGRKGQKQYGIDGSALRKNKKKIIYQCKNKIHSRDDSTKQKELLKDLEKEIDTMYREFVSRREESIEKFIFAHSWVRDTLLQDKADELSKKYDLSVVIWSWDEIAELIENNLDIYKKYYPEFFKDSSFIDNNYLLKKTTEELTDKINQLEKNLTISSVETLENEIVTKSSQLADRYFYLAYQHKDNKKKAINYFQKSVIYNHDYILYGGTLFDNEFGILGSLDNIVTEIEKIIPQREISDGSLVRSIEVIEKYIFQKKYVEALELSLKTLEINRDYSFKKALNYEARLRFNLGIAYSEEDDRINGKSEFIKSINLYSQIIKNEPSYFNKLIIVVSEMNRFYKNRPNIYKDMIEIYNDIEMNGLLSDKNKLSNLQNNFAILSEEFSKYNFAETLYEKAISNKDNREFKNIYYNFYLFYKKNTKLLYAKKILYNLVLEDNSYALEYYDLLVVLLEHYHKKSDINKIIDICKEIDTLNTKYQLNYYPNSTCKKYEDILEISKLHSDAVRYLKSLDNKKLNEKIQTVFVLQNSKLYQYFSDFYSKKIALKDINFSETTMYKMMTFVLGIAFISVSILALT